MDNKAIRRELARRLAAQDGGTTAFAKRVGDRSPAQMSGLLGPNAPRGIGDKLAREIEASHGLPPGWLDQEHNLHQADAPQAPTAISADTSSELRGLRELIEARADALAEELQLYRAVLNAILRRMESGAERDRRDLVDREDGGDEPKGAKTRAGGVRPTAKSARK